MWRREFYRHNFVFLWESIARKLIKFDKILCERFRVRIEIHFVQSYLCSVGLSIDVVFLIEYIHASFECSDFSPFTHTLVEAHGFSIDACNEVVYHLLVCAWSRLS